MNNRDRMYQIPNSTNTTHIRRRRRAHTAIFARGGRIHARSRLHLKSAIGYRRTLAGRIELELLQAALTGRA